MSNENSEGIRLNAKTIGAAVGLVSLVMAIFGGVGYLVRQDFRTTAVENEITELKLAQEKSEDKTERVYEQILTKVENLTTEVTKLTIALGNVQYKQEQAPRQ